MKHFSLSLFVSVFLCVTRPVCGQQLIEPTNRQEIKAFLDNDWQRFELRLNAYLLAYQSWVDQACQLSNEQRQLLTQATAEAAARFRPRFLDAMFKYHFYAYDHISTPLLFGCADHGAMGVFDQEFNDSLNKILLPVQRVALNHAADQRSESIHQASIGRIIDGIDDLIYLKPSQRELIRQKLSDVQPKFTHRYYTFRMDHVQIQEKPFLTQEWFPKEHLSPVQMEFVESFKKGYGGEFEAISADCTNEEFQHQIHLRAERMRPKLDSRLSLEVDCFPGELDESTRHLLQIARLGAVEQLLTNWCREQLSQLYHELPPNYVRRTYYLQHPNVLLIHAEPVWTELFQRDEFQAESRFLAEKRTANFKAYALMSFDQELWLNADQRSQFELLINDLSDRMKLGQRNRMILEGMDQDMWYFARLLYAMPEGKVKELLSTEQLKIWEILKKEFFVDEDQFGTKMFYCQKRHGEAHPFGPYWLIPTEKN